jgi:nucleoside-diphosphate-sugar epimerase
MTDATFYKAKNVLVTGGCSFIGSHLVESLVADGANVTIVDDLSSGLLKNIENVSERVDFVQGDLRDGQIASATTINKDIVFHLANIHGGRGFIETHPGEISQNFLIDGNIFYHSQLNGVERICYASSACAYPTNIQHADKKTQVRFLSEEMADPFKENAALADGEYGWAKFMGEMALRAYRKQFGQKGVSCRLFTVYGPRENESHAIIAFIAKALIKQDPYEIWGSGQQDRNFTFVSDIVTGMKLAAEKIDDCSAINIGTNEITKIFDAVKMVCELIGHVPNEFFFDTTKPEGVHARAASTVNQERMLGWKPSVSFKEGIKETIEWYKNQRKLEEIEEIVRNKLFQR